ncbi:hypothetical protein BU23DRAFT_325944 [Bimuria novae-zelandiae CBS 107.79]|uniref:Uncharacterized protein n=1 Tax=Bimuria novae-zelandiae CBS 107.79 TaxID=1447943 RepID=A0A6A5UNK1_9PLEO|nr:hypothetical protein BU23DRAFT_325944 [Bimuria novae-zelandiae CBS 107.79]
MRPHRLNAHAGTARAPKNAMCQLVTIAETLRWRQHLYIILLVAAWDCYSLFPVLSHVSKFFYTILQTRALSCSVNLMAHSSEHCSRGAASRQNAAAAALGGSHHRTRPHRSLVGSFPTSKNNETQGTFHKA